MSREDVIRKIVERDIQQLGLSEEIVRRESSQLHKDACEFYGTWDTALQYSGVTGRRAAKKPLVQPTQKRDEGQSRFYLSSEDPSPERVIRVIRRLCRNEYSLDGDRNRIRDERLYEAALMHFGSWEQALMASGINLQTIHMAMKDRMNRRDQILDELRQRHSLGLSLAAGVVSRENRGLYSSVASFFGCWVRGLLAAGLVEPSQLRRALYLDRQQVIDSILKRKTGDRSLSSNVVAKEDAILIYSARIYFDTWRDAVDVSSKTTLIQPPVD